MSLRRSALAAAAGLFVCGIVSAQAPQGVELKTPRDQVSYGFGLNVGRGMLRDGLKGEDIEFALLVAGLQDALNEQEPKLSEKEFQAAYELFQKELAPKLAARAKAAAEKNLKAGEDYLAENKGKPGVQLLKSGLQYKVIKQGRGKTPKATDVVRTKYRGTFIDGNEFDSSGAEPVEFPVNRVIKGWTEALMLMREGDKWQLFVPAAIAYGEQGFPPAIPPQTALVFEVELVEVLGADALKGPRN